MVDITLEYARKRGRHWKKIMPSKNCRHKQEYADKVADLNANRQKNAKKPATIELEREQDIPEQNAGMKEDFLMDWRMPSISRDARQISNSSNHMNFENYRRNVNIIWIRKIMPETTNYDRKVLSRERADLEGNENVNGKMPKGEYQDKLAKLKSWWRGRSSAAVWAAYPQLDDLQKANQG